MSKKINIFLSNSEFLYLFCYLDIPTETDIEILKRKTVLLTSAEKDYFGNEKVNLFRITKEELKLLIRAVNNDLRDSDFETDSEYYSVDSILRYLVDKLP